MASSMRWLPYSWRPRQSKCGDAELIPAFTEFLRDEGVGEETLQWVAPLIGLMQDMRDADNAAPRQLQAAQGG